MFSMRFIRSSTLGALLSAGASAAPVVIPHAGLLLDASDNPVQAASLPLRFSVYAGATGGNPLWTSQSCFVSVGAGRFATTLGDACTGPTPLDETVIPPGSERWIESTVAGVALSPRLQFSSVPSAAVALRSLDTESLRTKLASAGTLNAAENPVDWSQLKGVPTDVATGGNYVAGAGLQLAGKQLSVASGGIVDGMLAGAISGQKILPGTVNSAQLADGSVTGSKIAARAITVEHLADPIPLSATSGTLDASRLTGTLPSGMVPSVVRVGNVSDPCSATTAGTIRWTGVKFQGCDGTRWASLGGAPTVAAVSPIKIPSGGGWVVTLDGSNFTASTQVVFGSTPATSVTFVSGTRLTAVSPALTTLGATTVSVVAADGETAAFSGTITVGPGGDTAATAGTTCHTLKQDFAALTDGVYWLKPTAGTTAFQARCDMTTSGGGWTLLLRDRLNDSGILRPTELTWSSTTQGSVSGDADYILALASMDALPRKSAGFEYLVAATGASSTAGQFIVCTQGESITKVGAPASGSCVYQDGSTNSNFRNGISFHASGNCQNVSFWADGLSHGNWWQGSIHCQTPTCACEPGWGSTFPAALGTPVFQNPGISRASSYATWIYAR